MTFLKILSDAEQKAFDHPPTFSSDERKRFFHLSKWVEKIVTSLNTPTNKVGFVLAHGYFRATRKLFLPELFQHKDLEYVAYKLGIDFKEIDLSQYNIKSFNRHVKMILKKRGYRTFTSGTENIMMEEAHVLIERQLRPKIVLGELVDFLIKKRIEVPKYYVFARVITQTMNNYEQNLFKAVQKHITDEQMVLLKGLIQEKPHDNGDETSTIPRYILTPLKNINQSLKPKKIKKSIDDFLLLQRVHGKLDSLVKPLSLTSEAVRYYAHTVLKSDIYDLARKNPEKQYLFLTCFTVHQYYRHHDSLADILLRAVQSNLNVAEKEHKIAFYKEAKEKIKETRQLIDDYREQNKMLSSIKQIVHAEEWSDERKIDMIKSIVPSEKDGDLEKEIIKMVQQQVNRTLEEELFYDILQKNSRKLQNRAANIVKTLQFNESTANQQLLNAIHYYKQKEGDVGNKAPMDFLSDKEKKVIYNKDGNLQISLYKVFLFTHIANGIKSGELNLKDSYKYRSFDEYLIDIALWKENKDTYIKKAKLETFLRL